MCHFQRNTTSDLQVAEGGSTKAPHHQERHMGGRCVWLVGLRPGCSTVFSRSFVVAGSTSLCQWNVIEMNLSMICA
jgi:hypothetical protein